MQRSRREWVRSRKTPRTAPRAAPIGAAVTAAALLLAVLACGERETPAAEPAAPVMNGPHDIAVLEIRDLGEIHIELLPEVAPQTVANFEHLVSSGFYDGTLFHRVIPDFMIQGGDPLSKDRDPRNDGRGGLPDPIPDEFNSLSHVRGTVAMANSGRNTASSQLFIVQKTSPHLDGKYTIFGRVVKGMDIVDRITQLKIDKFGRWGPRDRPYPVQAVVAGARIEPAGVARAGKGRESAGAS